MSSCIPPSGLSFHKEHLIHIPSPPSHMVFHSVATDALCLAHIGILARNLTKTTDSSS